MWIDEESDITDLKGILSEEGLLTEVNLDQARKKFKSLLKHLKSITSTKSHYSSQISLQKSTFDTIKKSFKQSSFLYKQISVQRKKLH